VTNKKLYHLNKVEMIKTNNFPVSSVGSIEQCQLMPNGSSFFFLLFIYSYVYTLFESFLPSALLPPPSYPPLSLLPGRTCSALISNFIEEKT
jgi:hypothetical protein